MSGKTSDEVEATIKELMEHHNKMMDRTPDDPTAARDQFLAWACDELNLADIETLTRLLLSISLMQQAANLVGHDMHGTLCTMVLAARLQK